MFFTFSFFFSDGPRAEWYFGPIMKDVFFQDLLARPPYFSVAIDALAVLTQSLIIRQSAASALSSPYSYDPNSVSQQTEKEKKRILTKWESFLLSPETKCY